MTFLVDTNVLSEILKREPDPRVADWFSKLDRVTLSVITLEELIFGLRRRSLLKKEAWLRQMLADKGDILPVSDAAAHWCGDQRARLAKVGRIVTQADALIASCAWEHGLVLATRNTKDFDEFGIALINPFEVEPR